MPYDDLLSKADFVASRFLLDRIRRKRIGLLQWLYLGLAAQDNMVQTAVLLVTHIKGSKFKYNLIAGPQATQVWLQYPIYGETS